MSNAEKTKINYLQNCSGGNMDLSAHRKKQQISYSSSFASLEFKDFHNSHTQISTRNCFPLYLILFSPNHGN